MYSRTQGTFIFEYEYECEPEGVIQIGRFSQLIKAIRHSVPHTRICSNSKFSVAASEVSVGAAGASTGPITGDATGPVAVDAPRATGRRAGLGGVRRTFRAIAIDAAENKRNLRGLVDQLTGAQWGRNW